MRSRSAASILFDARRQQPAAASRSQAAGNPFREARKMSKNKSLAPALYHTFVVSHVFFIFCISFRGVFSGLRRDGPCSFAGPIFARGGGEYP
jgi:hypothetical protein